MKIELLDNTGMPFNLVRFFQVNGLQLLIYTKDDVLDEQGHITIHISTINNDGSMNASAVTDDKWDEVKGLIKNIVNANKNNQPLPIEDLDYNMLNGVSLNGDKALKLMNNYVELLKANQPVFEKEVTPIAPENTDNTNVFTNPEIPDIQNNEQVVPSMAHELPVIEQQLQPEYQPVYEEQTNVFNNFQPQYNTEEASQPVSMEQPIVAEQPTDVQDYQSMYFEQVEINNQLKSKITEYENKIETLKNIINN